MTTVLLFLIYLGAALLVAAQLFFPVYQALDSFWEIRPERVFFRLAMIIAILGFWPFLKMLNINNRYALGYSLNRRQFLRVFIRGLGFGVAIMGIHVLILVLFGVRIPAVGELLFGELLYVLVSGLLSGVLVALIEESLFRGAMQYHLRYNNSFAVTATLTSLVYASVHFIHPAALPATAVIDWNSGWKLLETMFQQYSNFASFSDSFVALFAAGLLLSLVRERTGNIALSAGMHAGWVLSIKLARETTDVATDSPFAQLIGSYDGIIGWAAAAVLGLVTLGYGVYGYYMDRRRSLQ